MRSTRDKKMFLVLATAVLGLSLWFALSQATAVVTPQPVPLKYMESTISARHAYEYEVELATNSTTLASVNTQMLSHLPKLQQVFNGADSRWQTISEFCVQVSCSETHARPTQEFETTSLIPEEALAVITSIPKFDYIQEQTLDNGDIVSFHQAMVEYNGNYYIVTMHTGWKS